jgi:hypothetical protein
MLISPTSPLSPSDSTTTITPTHQLPQAHAKQSSTSSHRSQLSRGESGRWSDRYFEDSSADDDDDEEVDPATGVVHSPTGTRLRRAFGGRANARGRTGPPGEGDHEEEDVSHDTHEFAKPGTSDAEITDFLAASPREESGPVLSPVLERPASGTDKPALVEEPEEMVRSGVTEDMTALPPLTGVGLGKKADEEVAGSESGSPGGLQRRRSVSETVARLSAERMREH